MTTGLIAGSRDRLIRLAERHPDRVLGYQDEVWRSRLARPDLHAWAGAEPMRLRQLEAGQDDPDPKALACYGPLRADTGGMMVRFVEGRPVSQATEEMAASAERDAAMIRSGLADPKDVRYRDANRKVPGDHLDEWKSHMLAKGRTEKHARTFRNRAERVIALAGAKPLSDLSPRAIQAALDAIRGAGLSNQAATNCRSALRAFCRWARGACVRTHATGCPGSTPRKTFASRVGHSRPRSCRG